MRTRARRSAALGIAGLLGAAWLVGAVTAGCDLLFPTRLSSAGPPDATAAHDASSEAAPDAEIPPCDAAEPPGPPASPPAAPDASTVIYAALQTVSFTAPDGGVLGFDLDGVCTCPGPGSCVPSSTGSKACDGPGGRDTAGDPLLEQVNGFLAAAGGDINARIASGQMTLILWIGVENPYDEGQDQAIVGVSFVSSLGLDGPDGAAPRWDGTDLWSVDVLTVSGYSTLADGGHTYIALPNVLSGYVTGGQLVVTGADFKLGLGLGSVPVTSAVVTAVVEPGAGGVYRLHGQIAGRIATSALLQLVAGIPDPAHPGARLCGSDQTYESFQLAACSAADLAASPSGDNVPGEPCEALSFAFAFTAVSSGLGTPAMPSYPQPGCDGGGSTCPR